MKDPSIQLGEFGLISHSRDHLLECFLAIFLHMTYSNIPRYIIRKVDSTGTRVPDSVAVGKQKMEAEFYPN